MMPSLMDAAAELRRELQDDYSDREELAAVIAAELRQVRPDTTTRGRQRAAWRAVGLEPPPTDMPEPKAGRRRKAKKATKRARKTGRQVARAGADLARPTRTATLGSLLVTTLVLVLLYNLLTTAERLTGLFGAVARAAQWLDNPNATIGGNT